MLPESEKLANEFDREVCAQLQFSIDPAVSEKLGQLKTIRM